MIERDSRSPNSYHVHVTSKTARIVSASACALLAFGVQADANTNNLASVLDGAGAWSSSGTLSNLSAVAQPGGVAVSSGGTYCNFAGFINTGGALGSTDTDQDGLIDMFDKDNDNDGIDDTVELAGTGFDPTTVTDVNNPDTDGDGVNDGNESQTGTDPTDIDAFLRFSAIHQNSPVTLVWPARGGTTYNIYRTDDSLTNSPTLIGSTNVAGGTAPWFVITNTFTDASAPGTDRSYYVIGVP